MSVNKAGNICRTCLSTDGDFIPLFSIISKISLLANKIMNISNVTMHEQDGLPHMICKKCIFLVESFDCFKKQIESTNEKMRKNRYGSEMELKMSQIERLGKFNYFVEDDEDSDSDYEVQYISEEVQRQVENAFKRKRRIYMMNKLAALNLNYMHLSEYHNALLLFAMRNLGTAKVNKINDYCAVMSEFMKEIPQNEDIDIEVSNVSNEENTLNSVEVKTTRTEGFDDDIEPETLQSANSDCNERLIIAVEDFDESDNKIQDSDCMELEENVMHENVATSMTENAKNIEQQSFVEQFNRKSENENDISEHADAVTMVENIEQLQHFFYRDKTKILHASTDEKIVEQLNIDSASDREAANLQTGKLENFGENISDKQFYCGNEEDDMMVNNPLGIQEEVVETSKWDNKEETHADMKNFDKNFREKNFHRETLNYENVEDNSGTSGIDTIEKDPLQLSNISEETEQVGELEIVEKSFRSEELTTESARSNEGEKENSTPVNTHENFPSKKELENVTFEKKSRTIDVIVISSDSSDEERRKTYQEAGNQGISRLARRTRQKLPQSRSAVRKVIRVTRCSDKKTWLENGKNEAAIEGNKKFQPRKYFHCTSCNINLYSVSAVLHHHNQTHTPLEELLHCQMCDVQFATKTILQAHFDHHHETHLFRCSFCACEFVLKKNLRAHMNAHLRPKVEEPESKRHKIDEPRGGEIQQLPVQEHLTNPTNDENFSLNRNIDTDQKIINQEREV